MARPRLISDAQILDATRKAVFDEGAHVSLDVIADSLGVSQPALLKRFGTRKDLMLAALRPPEVPTFTAQVDAGPDDRPLGVQLGEVFNVVCAYFEEHAPRLTALRESGIPICDIFPKNTLPTPLRTTKTLQGWLQRAQARQLVGPVDVETTAFAIMSTFIAHSHMKHMLKRAPIRGSQRAFLESITEFFTRALAPTTPAARSKPLRSAS
ncbi:MAG: TetR/AcrR family transcriptional regulator [Archangium sp.]|nr:TetR/AcrR family transcriptional regulator [Archangium sp.]